MMIYNNFYFKAKENPLEAKTKYVVDVLLHVTNESASGKNPDSLVPFDSSSSSSLPKNKGEMIVVPVHLNLIHQVLREIMLQFYVQSQNLRI